MPWVCILHEPTPSSVPSGADREYKKLKKAHERMQEEATTHNLVRATAMSGAMVMGMARDLALLKAAQPQLHFAPATAPAFDPASVSDKELREVRTTLHMRQPCCTPAWHRLVVHPWIILNHH